MNRLQQFNKFWAALGPAAAVAVSAGLLSGTAERWTVGCIAVGGAFLVALAPKNKTPDQ